MQERIAVFTEDRRFSENLCRQLGGRGRIRGSFIPVADREALEEMIGREPESTYLTDRQAADGELRAKITGKLIYLTDVKGYPEIDGIRSIFKFQSISEIETELLKALRTEDDDAGSSLFRTRYIGVISPVGRSLKTSFCLTLGQLLSQKARVLYVNLEPFSGFEELFEREFPRDLSDLLYAYETGQNEIKAEEFTEHFHGLKFVAPVCVPEDIYRTDPMLLRRIITDLQRSGSYDTVILDLSSDYRHAEALIPMCRHIYVPARKDLISEAKVRAFREWLERISGKNSALHTEELLLPYYQSFSAGRQYLEQLLWSELGDYVRSLLGSMA